MVRFQILNKFAQDLHVVSGAAQGEVAEVANPTTEPTALVAVVKHDTTATTADFAGLWPRPARETLPHSYPISGASLLVREADLDWPSGALCGTFVALAFGYALAVLGAVSNTLSTMHGRVLSIFRASLFQYRPPVLGALGSRFCGQFHSIIGAVDALLRLGLIFVLCIVGSSGCAERFRATSSAISRTPLFRVPRLPIGAFVCAIIWVSHWFLHTRTVVRGGINADTLVPFRLYHNQHVGCY